MPKKPAALASLPDFYRAAFHACTALWPLFVIRVLYSLLSFLFALMGGLVCFMPLLKNIYDQSSDLDEKKLMGLVSQFDWMGYFGDFHNLIAVALFITLGIVLGILMWAFFDAAVFGQFNRYHKKAGAFSFQNFLMDGLKKMLGMLGLLLMWIVFGIFMSFIGLIVFVLIGAFISHLLPWWIDILLILPGALAAFLVVSAFLTFASLSAAHLVEGYGVLDSINNGVSKAFQFNGRAIWAMFFLWLVYLVFIFAFSIVFGVFSLIPMIGIFFVIIKVLVTTLLAIGFNIYMASLSVAFQLEPDQNR